MLLDRHGEALEHFPRKDLFRHRPATLDEIPADLVEASLVAEDQRFDYHDGIDYLAVIRALHDSWKMKRIVSGASTISQQLIKISSPAAPRTLAAKLREALTARHLEYRWSKKEILAAYLNRLDYGHHRQGCREAAEFYFGKPLADLSLAECAFLAGLPQAPSRLDPFRHPERAMARRNWILDRLAAVRHHDPYRVAAARAEPLRLHPPGNPLPAPHLAARTRPSAQTNGGLHTTINRSLQESVNGIVHNHLTRVRGANVQHAAVVVIENATGEVLALVGSGDFDDPRGGQIDGSRTPRSAGSTLKPFTYLLALEHNRLHPASIIPDIPTKWQTREGLEAPRNFDGRHHGPVTIRHALANSLNVAAMHALNDLGGPETLHALLVELGVTSLDRPAGDYGLGLTIGNAEIRLVELTNAFASLARLGEHLPPRFLTDEQGTPPRRVASREAAYMIADILADNAARSPAFGHASALRLPFRCAVKTGTSSDFRDAWCIGFTRELTVGVWAGNFDNSPMKGMTGATGAGPIFRQAMMAAHHARPPGWIPRPEGVTTVNVDTRTGRRPAVPPRVPSPFIVEDLCLAGAPPEPALSLDYDARGNALLGREYREWFSSGENTGRDGFAIRETERMAVQPKIMVPLEEATYLLDPELPSGGRRLTLISNLTGDHSWSSPTLRIAGAVAELTPGAHTIILHDPLTGSSLERRITVESL